jgi:hypothetical protein
MSVVVRILLGADENISETVVSLIDKDLDLALTGYLRIISEIT